MKNRSLLCKSAIAKMLIVIIVVILVVGIAAGSYYLSLPTPSPSLSPTQTVGPNASPTPPPTPAPTPTTVDLGKALSLGLVQATVSGSGLQRINIALKSTSDSPLQVVIPLGTIFETQSAGVQSMIVIERSVISLKSRDSVSSLNAPTACAKMELDTPDENDTFTISGIQAPDDLFKLLTLSDLHDETFRVKQFAIWTITDNPTRDGYVGLGSFGFGTGPSDEEMQRIQALFEKAEIPTNEYQALSFQLPSPSPSTTPTLTAPPTTTPTPSPTPSPTSSPTPVTVDLDDAVSGGLVQETISGNGLQRINIALKSTSDSPLQVVIPLGTIFETQSAGVQSMIVIESRVLSLKSRSSVSSSVPVACSAMELDQPDENNTFAISGIPAPEDLVKLLYNLDFKNETFRVKQFAIWTITDNPTRDGYVGLGSFGFGTGPSDQEIQEIRTLFEKSGIPTNKYQALQ